jgi:hypothetical protein
VLCFQFCKVQSCESILWNGDAKGRDSSITNQSKILRSLRLPRRSSDRPSTLE